MIKDTDEAFKFKPMMKTNIAVSQPHIASLYSILFTILFRDGPQITNDTVITLNLMT